jgi:26S proteasome regulatory subunit T2
VIGVLPDDSDPMVSVMKVEKAPLESYADIGGLQDQVTLLGSTQSIFLKHDLT